MSRYIIKHKTKEKVWVGNLESCIFPSRDEAKTEFDWQVLNMAPGAKNNWTIEEI